MFRGTVFGLCGLVLATTASAQPYISNPDFDAHSVSGWTGSFGTTLSWSEDEGSFCAEEPYGGSMEVSIASTTFETFWVSYCSNEVPSEPITASFWAHHDAQDGVFCAEIEFFSQADCSGSLLGTTALNCGPNSGAWEAYGGFPFATPPNSSQSFRLTLEVFPITTLIDFARFDEIVVRPPNLLLRSGFETGGYCRWSSHVP